MNGAGQSGKGCGRKAGAKDEEDTYVSGKAVHIEKEKEADATGFGNADRTVIADHKQL